MACPALSSRQGGSAHSEREGGGEELLPPSESVGSLFMLEPAATMCDSEVKRFIFSIHQVPKTYSYFIMHLSEEAAICSDT